MGEQKIKKVHVVPHTHWDREWYEDFQGFRKRLVYMIDELLNTMEQDPEYKFFMMDGQTIVIDDYLEIRPERREQLLQFIQQGKIFVGPWYVMPDEFLVSGESLIRNLMIGHRRALSWGVTPVKSGYITDIFGHNSQFPQILRGFDIDNAVLFRGFYGDADDSEICWEAADGSRVLGLKLDEDRAYSDFYFFLRWPFTERDFQYDVKELIDRAKSMLEYKSKRATTPIILGLDGCDHVEIDPQLPWMLRTLNGSAEIEAEFVHSHLEAYLEQLRPLVHDLKVYKGEQRSPGYNGLNNMVMTNVLSSRIHLKQRNHQCETSLEKWAEPWGVFAGLEGRPYSKSFISKSWEILIQNHPHDSICGCSIDQVHKDMIYRFDQSDSISSLMIKEELDYITNHLDQEALKDKYSFTVFNSSQTTIEGVIEVEVSLPSSISANAATPYNTATNFKIFDHTQKEVPYQLLGVTNNKVRRWRPYRDIPHADSVNVLRIALPGNIPSFGYATYTIEKHASEGPGGGEYAYRKMLAPVRYPGTMQVNERCWDNGCMRLEVQSNGTINILDHQSGKQFKGLLLLEDEADIGDGWTHISPITNAVVSSLAERATISVINNGPYQTSIQISMKFLVPSHIMEDGTKRSHDLVDIPVCTTLILRKDNPIVECHTVIHNTARDHRMRLLFPTDLDASLYYTSTPFDLVKREISVPDYSNYMDFARDVVPHNGIVSIQDNQSGMAIYSKGLYEVAVRDNESRTLALTLYRSTHREVMTNGGDGGQLLNEMEFSYAIRPFAGGDTLHSTLWTEHQQYIAGIKVVDRKPLPIYYENLQRRQSDLPLTYSYMSVSAPELLVSAVKEAEDEPGSYVIRLLNTAEHKVEGILHLGRNVQSAQQVNLDEQPLSEGQVDYKDQDLKVAARPKEIVSYKVTFH